MIVFIGNAPLAYAWGSTEALPHLLGVEPDGTPQAELWLGAHPDSPARIIAPQSAALVSQPVPETLIELIAAEPEQFGFGGDDLPFLLKVLGIGAPLSLQVHPNLEQAREGFAREEAAGIARDAFDRSYVDANHKPELLVALSEVTALSGFRPVDEAVADIRQLLTHATDESTREAFEGVMRGWLELPAEAARLEALDWLLSGDPLVGAVVEALSQAVHTENLALDAVRVGALRRIIAAYPGDPAIVISLLLHCVRLQPGEAVYLDAGNLHAYLSGTAVEVMASSDNVLRAGLTQKHIDAAELQRIVRPQLLADPKFPHEEPVPGLRRWQPPVTDFQMLRARVYAPHGAPEHTHPAEGGNPLVDCAQSVELDVPHPLVLFVTEGQVQVERSGEDIAEVVNAKRGQSLYISAGGSLALSGHGEAYLATVGANWEPRGVSQSLK